MLHKWKLIDSKIVLDEKWYKVRRDTVEVKPGKIIDDYFVGVSADIVMVLAVTQDGQVVLVRQYKHGVQDIITELPAGMIDEGEEPLTAAKRELLEETGFTASSWEKVGYFLRNSSKSDGNNTYIFLAQGATQTGEQKFDEHEDIEVIMKSYTEALAMAKSGEIQSLDTVAALLLVQDKIG